MINLNILAKLKKLYSSLFSKQTNVLDFIINKDIERTNKTLLSYWIPKTLSSLEKCSKNNHIVLAVYICLLSNLWTLKMKNNFIDTKLKDHLKIIYTNLKIVISNLLQVNKLYLEFSKEEKRNIALNTLLDEFPTPVDKHILFHSVKEFKLLSTIHFQLIRVNHKTIDMYEELITQIEDLSKTYCPLYPLLANYVIKALDRMTTDYDQLTLRELHLLEDIIIWYRKSIIAYETLVQKLSENLAELTEINDYLERKTKK
jgi:hypothetical protein